VLCGRVHRLFMPPAVAGLLDRRLDVGAWIATVQALAALVPGRPFSLSTLLTRPRGLTAQGRGGGDEPAGCPGIAAGLVDSTVLRPLAAATLGAPEGRTPLPWVGDGVSTQAQAQAQAQAEVAVLWHTLVVHGADATVDALAEAPLVWRSLAAAVGRTLASASAGPGPLLIAAWPPYVMAAHAPPRAQRDRQRDTLGVREG
jgi:hypothetical protein